MTHRLGRVHTVRIIALLTMATMLLGLGSLLFRRLINAESDIGFGAIYVLVPLIAIAALALIGAAVKIGLGKD